MKCDKDYFPNENVGGCFPCADICDLKGTGNSKDYCLKNCPEYNPVSPQTLETNTNLEIIIPVVIIVLVASIIIGVVLIRKRRKRNLPPPEKPLKWTEEEKGDELEKQRLPDSGIDTHRVDIDSDDSQTNDNTFQEQPRTGLSELHCNSRYLKNASDASGAQALIA